jgi:hypothetical protein
MNVKVVLALALLAVAIGIGVTSFKNQTPYILFAGPGARAGSCGQRCFIGAAMCSSRRAVLGFRIRTSWRGHADVFPAWCQEHGQATSIVAIGHWKHSSSKPSSC